MYERITDEDPYKVPMRIYPAIHYTMGGLWVDYNLMSNVPGLYVLGEANFSDHGANRLGASALMQGLADGYFVLPSTISDYLAPLLGTQPVADRRPRVPRGRGRRSHDQTRAAAVDQRHALGRPLPPRARQHPLGQLRHGPQPAEPREGARRDPRAPRGVLRRRAACSASDETLNQSLEKAGRVADFLEFGELLCLDALTREESCGGHFRVEHQTEDGEALRDDENFSYVAAWEFTGVGARTDAPQGAARVRVRPPRPAQLQVGGRASQSPWTSSSASGARRAPTPPARSRTIDARDISPEMSFLELFDVLNERLVAEGREPIAFDHDCREGICGSCSMMINGRAHGPSEGTATCQLHMRKFHDGDEITVEPWRARAFPIIRDLVVDRSAFDRIIEAGGYITAPTGSAPDANLILVPKEAADAAMDAAACIGCGACVAACPNGAAQLFTAAKVAHLSLLPQGQPERYERVVNMVETMESYFGSCTNHGECEKACPKEISIDFIALLNRDYVKAQFKNRKLAGQKALTASGRARRRSPLVVSRRARTLRGR